MDKYLLFVTVAIVMISTILVTSCSDGISRPTYPRYSLIKIESIPDSLKVEHGEYIIKLVTAGYQNGVDNEDVDDAIIIAKRVADKMFTISQMGLRKEYNEDYDDDMKILRKDLTPIELRIYEELMGDSNKYISLSRFKLRQNLEIIKNE